MFRLIPRQRIIPSLFKPSLRFNTTIPDSSVPKPQQPTQQKDTKINIDELLKSSIPELSFQDSISERFGFDTNRQQTPREVAKGIKEFGTNAGRSIDVNYNNLSRTFIQIKRLNNENKIKYLQKIQSRYIRPAKYRKQLKREWWRRKFSSGFKDLLAQVNDARRRGY
ncbi:uncharacterized protein KGF55_000126 [Candida pseudojiufengensis]|uniref:uncharacterized protein n=1 Tax=Candida pseudojiufengensis TaxID=497109 RepID=UPI002224B97F|nr:uncharacterized protein KGF55_000126 [Candida pseudojiufengensis]KAI5966717.1 hypothetical protein KGF55_000126 [Candida pseudojiufengensis]